jgi:hypothetical protein
MNLIGPVATNLASFLDGDHLGAVTRFCCSHNSRGVHSGEANERTISKVGGGYAPSYKCQRRMRFSPSATPVSAIASTTWRRSSGQPHTAKINGTIYVTAGHTLYSDKANPMMTIVEDTVGVNDVICGSCSYALDVFRYGEEKAARMGCMDLFEAAIEPWGPERKDIPMCFNIFLDYPVKDDGHVAIDKDPVSKPGDHVDLKAEMDLLVAITACPQENNPCTGYNPTPIRVAVY